MAENSGTTPGTVPHREGPTRAALRGLVVLAMGCLAIAAPFYAGPMTFYLIGALAIASGMLELLEALRAPDDGRLRSAYLSGEVSIIAGGLLLSVPALVLRGLSLLLAASFCLDGLGKLGASARARWAGTPWSWLAVTAALNLGLAGMLVARWPVKGWPVVAFVVGLRMLTAGWSMLRGRHTASVGLDSPADAHADTGLGLPPHKAFATLNESIDAGDQARRGIDAWWCGVFVLLFFVIHVGRMRVYWNAVGMVAPLAAVLGDLAVAFAFAFVVVLPARLTWRKLTRPLERRAWRGALAGPDEARSGSLGRLKRFWLTGRLRFARRVARMRHSPRAALGWGLKVGLPITAVWISIQPIFGDLNYFFNSENWSSIVWHRWAETRTDRWRENMVLALNDHYQDVPPDRLFRVEPEGVSGKEDFSFLVIGDNGDGSGAQHSLRDRYLTLGQRPDIKFLVCSSDVIYPDGAMRDYEHNFHLPFKGFTKPIYAIPGNHDWYDALEGFAANFLRPEAARTCMRSRVETDGRLTTTTEGRIDGYIQEAARLRHEYGLKVGTQRGPFFEVQADRFALIAVDTGVLKTVDGAQWRWFRAALERARGKFKMVLLGHPLFTAGHYQGDAEAMTGEWASPLRSPIDAADEAACFTAVHRLLREHEVELVMAGDMHLLEHYREPYESGGKTKVMSHFVNGGGGAFICVGVPFDWPREPATEQWMYYPRMDAVIAKLDQQTPLWKQPLWLWVKHLSGWPFNGYIMSAAFDHARAPYFQSFVEVRVGNSTNEVRVLPHCAAGRLRWRDLQNFESLMPPDKAQDNFVEFVIPMPRP
ncbi:MAG: metallophosphoesterase [Gemmataceae bacterium]